jgi:hypothetical protein
MHARFRNKLKLENSNFIVIKIYRSNYHLAEEWGVISTSAKDLITKMLTYD